jgi:multiple sugar transport system permease protein
MVTALVGYGFARFRFPGRGIWFALVVVSIVIPPQTITVPMYMQFRYFDMFGLFKLFGVESVSLIDSFYPMTMMTLLGMGIKSGLYIFIFRQFFRGLPKEIEEAALIDGAGVLRTYLRVMLPNAVPAIVTVLLFSFVWQYNDTFFANTFMSRLNLIAVKLATVGGTFAGLEGIRDANHIRLVTNAAIVLGIAPIVTVYLLLQRYFMEGIERSGIVG